MARKNVTRGAAPKLARSSRPRTAAKSTTRRKSSRSSSDDTNLLGTYFREMSELSVMTPDEEKAAATKIAMLRVGYWTAIFSYPPYTEGLMGSIPSLHGELDRLIQIPGSMPRLSAIPAGCAFNPRCPSVKERCRHERPDLMAAGDSEVACWLYDTAELDAAE